jgi:hypothetical protein
MNHEMNRNRVLVSLGERYGEMQPQARLLGERQPIGQYFALLSGQAHGRSGRRAGRCIGDGGAEGDESKESTLQFVTFA